MRLSALPLALALTLYASAAHSESPDTSPRPGSRIQSSGASSEALSLEAALAMALDRSPALAAATNEAATSEGQLTQARTRPNPELDLSVEDTQTATRVTTGLISIPIETGGKRAARIQAAEHSLDLSGHDLAASRAELRASVIAAFFAVAVAQETVRVTADTVDIAQSALQLAQRRVAAGKVPPLESSRAEVELAKARIEARTARTTLETARRRLSQLWGEPQPGFSTVQTKLEALPGRPSIDHLQSALATSPRVLAAKAGVDLGRAQLEVEKSKRYPDVRVSLGVARDNELGRNRALFGVAVPLPLFDRNQGNVYSAQMQAYKSQDTYREVESRLASELLQGVSRYDLAADSAQDYRSVVLPAASKAYEGARKGFEAGKVGYLDVLDAQRTLSRANLDYLDVLANAYQAAADIDRILGR